MYYCLQISATEDRVRTADTVRERRRVRFTPAPAKSATREAHAPEVRTETGGKVILMSVCITRATLTDRHFVFC